PPRRSRFSQFEGVRQELVRPADEELSLVHEGNPVEPELVQPLTARAARRRRDPDRLEVARLRAVDDRQADGAALGADAHGIRGVLDVHAGDDAPVPQECRGADQEFRIGGVGRLRSGQRRLVELLVRHRKTWKRIKVTSVPMTAPATTSYGVWISASTRVWETRSAMIRAVKETTMRWSVTMNVIAAQQPKARAA